MKTASSAPNFNYGFPAPGPQAPSGTKVMDHVFFLSNEAWQDVRENQRFDYVVIGSGFCGLAFVQRVYERRPDARILMIERGPFFLPAHFQNLPMPFVQTLGGMSETFPWTLSATTVGGDLITWQHGMVPFFGGRSTLWSAWCPRPLPDEMNGWPQPVIDAAAAYFASAEALLNVVPASEIDKGTNAPPPGVRPVYGVLQERITAAVVGGLSRIPYATRAMAAPLAVGPTELHGLDFEKFAVPGPLLQVVTQQAALAAQGQGEPLRIVTECVVSRVLQQDGRATALETSRGVVNVADAKVVLAMGTLPPTTLVLNSFPQVPNAGERFTAHFISAIVARVRRADYFFANELGDLELAAVYLAGKGGAARNQFHVQLTALSDRDPATNAATAQRHMPDVVATASMEQLLSSEDYVVFVCAVLGELSASNPQSWFRRTDSGDETTNVMLQVVPNADDLETWDAMDVATFTMLEDALSPGGAARVEYWHPDGTGSGSWAAGRPPASAIRVPALVHEGSTLWIGEDESAPVGLDYRPRGVGNVYVTGAGLWPQNGSWNPTMTMVALTQHLADTLEAERGAAPLLGTRALDAQHPASPMG